MSTSRAHCSRGTTLFFTGDLNDIAKDNPEIALQKDGTIDPTKTWFNIEAGFEKATANQPAGFQKRVFPFRVDGVRGFDLSFVNANFSRTFDLGGRRTIQFRMDIQNLLNRQQYQQSEHSTRPARTSVRSGRHQRRDAVHHVQHEVQLLTLGRRVAGFFGARQPALGCRHEALTVAESGNNLGTIAPEYQGKRGSRADQKAGRINKIDVPALSAKPPSPVQIRAAPPACRHSAPSSGRDPSRSVRSSASSVNLMPR